MFNSVGTAPLHFSANDCFSWSSSKNANCCQGALAPACGTCRSRLRTFLNKFACWFLDPILLHKMLQIELLWAPCIKRIQFRAQFVGCVFGPKSRPRNLCFNPINPQSVQELIAIPSRCNLHWNGNSTCRKPSEVSGNQPVEAAYQCTDVLTKTRKVRFEARCSRLKPRSGPTGMRSKPRLDANLGQRAANCFKHF